MLLPAEANRRRRPRRPSPAARRWCDGEGRMFDLRQLERAQERSSAQRCRRRRRMPGRCWRSGSAPASSSSTRTTRRPAPSRCGARLVYVERLKRERPGTAGSDLGHARQSRPGIAFAAHRYGVPVTIYVPHGNSVEKNRADARLRRRTSSSTASDFQAAREEADRRAETRRP